MQAEIANFNVLDRNQRIVDEDERGLVLGELCLEPLKLLFSQTPSIRIEVRRLIVLCRA